MREELRGEEEDEKERSCAEKGRARTFSPRSQSDGRMHIPGKRGNTGKSVGKQMMQDLEAKRTGTGRGSIVQTKASWLHFCVCFIFLV